jgi:hypothetical protein
MSLLRSWSMLVTLTAISLASFVALGLRHMAMVVWELQALSLKLTT